MVIVANCRGYNCPLSFNCSNHLSYIKLVVESINNGRGIWSIPERYDSKTKNCNNFNK